MATFQYEAMNSVGQVVKGEVDASSSEDAITKIRGLGHFPTKIKEQKAAKKGPSAKVAEAPTVRRRGVGRVPTKTLTTFTRQLSTLQDAGLPILRSLRILEEQQKPGSLRMAIKYVADDVESGATLSEAMARHPKCYDKLYSNMVAAGEAGGVLDIVLRRLAEFMEASQKLQRRIIGAMVYPVAVMFFAGVIVMGIMIFIIPKFKEMFTKEFGSDLPGPTKILMDASDWIGPGNGWAVIIAIPIVFTVIWKLVRQSAGGRTFTDTVKLKIPVMGQIIAKTCISRFTRTLGTLLTAGVPILEAINITRETTGNEVFAKALEKVHDGIREGEDFAAPLRSTKIVDPMVINMIDVGEETGDLDKMLNKVADTYDEEVDALVAAMMSMMEPLMVIVLGVVVGGIVLAVFAPMPAMLEKMQSSK